MSDEEEAKLIADKLMGLYDCIKCGTPLKHKKGTNIHVCPSCGQATAYQDNGWKMSIPENLLGKQPTVSYDPIYEIPRETWADENDELENFS